MVIGFHREQTGLSRLLGPVEITTGRLNQLLHWLLSGKESGVKPVCLWRVNIQNASKNASKNVLAIIQYLTGAEMSGLIFEYANLEQLWTKN